MSTVTRPTTKFKTHCIRNTTDIVVQNCGSLFLFSPTTTEAWETLVELCPRCDYLYAGRSLVVEPRYAEAVAEQMRDDGLSVA